MAFTKHLGQTFLPSPGEPDGEEAGPTPAEATSGDNATVPVESVSASEKDKFKKLLTAYYEALSRRAVKDHTVSLQQLA